MSGRPGAYSAPQPITPDHALSGFSSGKPALDNWLNQHALANEGRASRTYVVATEGKAVAAYYTLATASVALTDLPQSLRHNLPNPVPALVLGRLAVDERHQGSGLGTSLLRDAMLKALEVSRTAGVRLLIVHPIDDEAAAFYRRHDFRSLKAAGTAMYIAIEKLAASL